MNKGSREGLPPQSTVYVAALLILCLEFAAPLSLFARQLTTPMPNSNMPALLQQFDGKNPPEIATVLSRWAASDKAGDQECLRSALGSEELLLRLNSADEHARLRPDQLRVSSVLAALATNQSAPARATIDFLAGNAAFLADLGRQDLLLEAVRRVRPATPAMIHFFEEQTRPDAANLYLAMDCLVDNGSEPAAALIEKIFGRSPPGAGKRPRLDARLHPCPSQRRPASKGLRQPSARPRSFAAFEAIPCRSSFRLQTRGMVQSRQQAASPSRPFASQSRRPRHFAQHS